MADNPDVDKAVDRVKQIVAALPWWGWAVAGGGVLGGVAYYRKRSATTNTSNPAASANVATAGSTPEYQPPDGLSMSDLAGMPYDYYDWSAALTPGGQPLPAATAPDTTATSGTTSTVAGNPAPATPAHASTPASHPASHPAAPTSSPAPSVHYQRVGTWPEWDSTLSGIAAHYGTSWEKLYGYGNNRAVIDSAAHAHGHYSAEYNWLFPGEELQVP